MQTTCPEMSDHVDNARLLAQAIEERARNKRDRAWPIIVERYTPLVVSVTSSFGLRSADAVEVRQEVWALLFQNMQDIRQPQRLAGWIKAVTRNECLRRCRQSFREVPGDDEAAWAPAVEEDLEGQILVQQRHVALRHALAALPHRGRVLLETLLEQPDLSHAELAAKLGMPIGSIGPTRQRCVRQLRAVPELARLR